MRTDYQSILEQQYFSGADSFCDETGTVNPDLPVAKFRNQFVESNGKTLVTVVTEYASEVQLRQVIQMGMQEGLTIAYENLDNTLNQLKMNLI